MPANLFGREPAPDHNHLRRWSLTADTMPENPTPVVLGSEWYEKWSRPWIDPKGNAWLAHPESDPDDWGPVVGGHAYCLNPVGAAYSRRWQKHYDQQRNDCTAYSSSIMMSLLNRVLYDPRPVYDYTLLHDEWSGNADEGTSVRATMDTLRDMGEVLKSTGEWSLGDGIAANRWCRSVEQIAAVLSPWDRGRTIIKRGYAILRQSWGPDFPYAVRVPTKLMQIVIFDSGWGDATLVTDR